MSERFGLIDKLLHRGAMRRWTRALRMAPHVDLALLRAQRSRARALYERLDALIFVTDSRLALPRIGSTAFSRPQGTDWSWRPNLWRGPLRRRGIAAVQNRAALGNEVTVFHDCSISEITLRQIRNDRETDLAPFGLRLDVFSFDGSFLSLVLDLPSAATEGLKKRHIVRVDAAVELEKPISIFLRLNVKHGPNAEQMVRELPLDGASSFVEFDLAYSALNEKRVEKMWIDLIFDDPEMNEITLRDLTFCRYPRSEI